MLNSRSLFILLLTITPLFAFTLKQSDQELTRNIVAYIINNQYDSAILKLQQRTDWQQEPLLPLLKLCILSLRDVDFDRTVDSSLFASTYDLAITSVERWEQIHRPDPYSLMVAGMARSINSASLLRQKRYIPALQLGLDAVALLKKAQDLDPINYEVDLVLGLYEYGRAELRSRFWWVLFWYPGDRESGIIRVTRCADNAVLMAEAARISLCDIFVQEKRFRDAHDEINHLKQSFPESRFVYWSEVKCYEAEKNYQAAARVYQDLARSYSIVQQGQYNTLFTKNRAATMLFRSGRLESAKKICDELVADATINRYDELKRETIKLSERCNAARN